MAVIVLILKNGLCIIFKKYQKQNQKAENKITLSGTDTEWKQKGNGIYHCFSLSVPTPWPVT